MSLVFPQSIFSEVMPLVNLNCFSWMHAICNSFYQPVASSARHGDSELIKKNDTSSHLQSKIYSLIINVSDVSQAFSESLQTSLCHDTGKE